MTNLLGKSIGSYHILEKLGEGGMATVYKAIDTRIEREVAIKIIRADIFGKTVLERIYRRFDREANSLARLSHRHIVSVIEYGEHDGAPFLVMEYISGGTLKQKLGRPVPWMEAIQLLLPIAQALDYAHKNRIIHRDVKPSNILITEGGELKLTDFGIAKVLESDDSATLATTTGVGVGTPEYMAPEQGLGHDVDARVDIYSLGVIVYEMITGRKPFRADTPMAVVIKHVNDPLPKPSLLILNLPDAVERLLLKALAKQPRDRYRNMADFSKALDSLLEESQIKGGNVGETFTAHSSRQDATTNKQYPKRITANDLTSGGVEGEGGLNEIVVQKRTRNIFSSFSFRIAITVGLVLLGIGLIRLPSLALHSFSPTLSPTETLNNIEILSLTLTPTIVSPPNYEPTITPIPNEIIDAKNIPMILVPAGDFEMGSDSGDIDSMPAHTVFLDSYYIDKYEVSNALYDNCVSNGVCKAPWSGSAIPFASWYKDNPQFPVILIDWPQAEKYCEWRDATLPTEAQWEKAARGVDGRTYPWGEVFECKFGNFASCYKELESYGTPIQPGSFAEGKSYYGVYDMAGNVWEYVADWYNADYYRNSPSSNPLGPSLGQSHVIRGGGWYSNYDDVTTYARSRDRFQASNGYTNSYGFRCAKPAP